MKPDREYSDPVFDPVKFTFFEEGYLRFASYKFHIDYID